MQNCNLSCCMFFSSCRTIFVCNTRGRCGPDKDGQFEEGDWGSIKDKAGAVGPRGRILQLNRRNNFIESIPLGGEISF